MEGVIASAQQFLSDANAVEAALQIDRKRAASLRPLRDAFEAFRDRGESLDRLASRIQQPLWEVCAASRGGTPRNLWGFQNEDERQFSQRFAAAAPRLPELDLGSVFREYLTEEPARDEARIQQLLAFGEFVASLDACGRDGDPRLGVGPAANFLTFAWHCLSEGRQPVFLYSSSKAIKAIAESGGLGADAAAAGRDLEQRFRTFYVVARSLENALTGVPRAMRSGWAVEHALDYVLDRIEGTRNLGGEEPGTSGMWRPRSRSDLREEQGRRPQPLIVEGRRSKRQAPDEPSDEEIDALLDLDPATLTPATAAKRDRFMEISKKSVVHAETRMFEKSGVDISEALPPDRSGGADTPFFTIQSPRKDELRREEEAREQVRRKADTRKIKRLLAEQARARREAKREGEPGQEQAPPAAPPPAPREPDPRPVIESPSSEEGVFIEPPTNPRVERRSARPTDTTRQTIDAQLSEFRGEFVQASRGTSRLSKGTPGAAHLSRELHLDHELCEEMLYALDERSRVLLVGPPASGKTYVARRLAIHLAGHEDRVLCVRLHPDLTYAELIDGPGGAGIIRAHCELAQGDRDRTYVLVLDELDRGDAARALGEFLGGLTEPGQNVRLARSGAAFHVPRNLRVIATARELPHDPALIGRFSFVRHPADTGILRRFLEHCGRELGWAVEMLDALNARLAEQGRTQRVGHGLLMDPHLDVARLQRIWRREVLPLLECQGVDTSSLDYASLRGRK